MKTTHYIAILLVLIPFFLHSQEVGDTIHVSHYNIHLTDINPVQQSITGWSEATVISKLDNINSFSMELKALSVDSVRVNNDIASFAKSGELVRIELPNTINVNDDVSVTIWYHGKPFHESWGGFHWDGDYAFNLGVGFESIPHNLGKTWFPCIDNFTDRATYDFYVTVDTSKKAVCGGVLQEVTDKGDGTSTWHWRLAHPIPTYLASVAVGNYVLVKDEYYGIEDTIPITFYVRPSDSSKVDGSFANLKNTLHFYETWFGAYPFGRVGYVGTAIGAMEHAGNIAYPNFAINGNSSNESLYSHELSHMWFGDKVTCSRAEEMWLNEGWASFCEMFYLEGLDRHDQFVTEMRDRNYKVLQKSHTLDQGYWALANVPQQYTYGSTSYDKGAVVVYTLKGYLGDSLFSKAMTAYLHHFAYQSASSEDMQNFLTNYTGINMKPFFDAWVFTPGTPHFSLDSTRVTPIINNRQVDIYLRQRYKGADNLADDNILEVGFLKDDFTITTDTVRFSGKFGHSVKNLPFQPLAVMLDPFEKTADATTDNFKIIRQTGQYSFPDTFFNLIVDELNDSAFVRVTHNWVAPDTLKHPVTGLRISPNRYWQVEGYIPGGTKSKGQFYFSSSSYLDGDMNLSTADSVMILYRAATGDEWEYVPQTILGGPTIGYIYVDNIKPGEYTLAALNKEHLGITHLTENRFKIYPNPTNGRISIDFDIKANYRIDIRNTNGEILGSYSFYDKRKTISIKRYASGTLLVSIFKNGQLFGSQKVSYYR